MTDREHIEVIANVFNDFMRQLELAITRMRWTIRC